MKKILLWLKSRSGVFQPLYLFMIVIVCFTACKKEPGFRVDFPPFLDPADVIDKWMTLEIRI